MSSVSLNVCGRHSCVPIGCTVGLNSRQMIGQAL